MKLVIDYVEQADTTQPAEVFEDALDTTYPKLSGKLLRVVSALRLYGHQLGGGYLEKCHDYEGLWEIRVIHRRTLARELLGFDGNRIVLLHGYSKRTGQTASTGDLKKAFNSWTEYFRTRNFLPAQKQ